MSVMNPQNAKSSKTWTSQNKPWSSPVQTSLPELVPQVPNANAPASDNGLVNYTSQKLSREGSLAKEINGFRQPANDFDNAYYGTRPQVSKSWKP